MRLITTGFIASAFFLGGCSSIEKNSTPQQALGRLLIAGIGDVVVRIDKERSLTNAFGKADIWGRKTNEGYSEVRFAGIEPTGYILLYRHDVQVISNETTMTRTPLSFTTGSSHTTISGTSLSNGNAAIANAQARSTGSATTINSGSSQTFVVPSDAIAIRLSPTERKVPVAGYLLEVIEANQNSIQYKVSELPR